MKKTTQPKVNRFQPITPLAFRIYSSTLALFIALILNTLAALGVLNGMTTGQVSDLYNSLLTPSDVTFSIWGLIYVSLIWFSLTQLRAIHQLEFATTRERFFKLHGWYFLVSMLNAIWIVFWQYQIIEASLIVILAMLGSLIQMVLLLRHQVFWIRFPFSVYAAWITFATVANITTYLVTTDYVAIMAIAWNQPGAVLQTVGILLIVSALAAIWIWRENDLVVGGVVSWSLLGIYLRHANDLNQAYPSVLEAALLLTIFMLIWTVFIGLKNRLRGFLLFRK